MSLDGAMTRVPVNLDIISLDCCGLVFGVGDCAATGEPCYNSWFTCKYPPAFDRQSRDYEFVSCGPLPWPGPRPYVKTITPLPTEVRDTETVTGRFKVTLIDEPDNDVGIDPYVAQRATVQGTYFKKLLARNPNYKGRLFRHFEGFLGESREQFVEKFRGTIAGITLASGQVTIEAADALKALADIYVPPKLSLKLLAAVDDVQTEMTLNSLTGLAAAGYLRLEDEIIQYGSLNVPTGQILECSRGEFGTTASGHDAKTRVEAVRYFPPQNPFDLLLELLQTDCGWPAENIDIAAVETARDWPGGEVPFSALLTESHKAAVLVFELADLLDCNIWIGEDLRLTLRRNLPNAPGRDYLPLTDAAHIANQNASVDLNDKGRATRVILYWDQAFMAADGETASYGRADIGVDRAAESPNGYNEQVEKVVWCRWLRQGYLQEELMDNFVADFVLRRLLNIRDARPIISVAVELKDGAIKTGDYCLLQTDELSDAAGLPISERYQVVKREPKGQLYNLQLQRLMQARLCFIAPDDAPAYDVATQDEQEYGYIADDNGRLADAPGYVNW